ncbi:polysaccharide lyase 8 family protein [Nonomuraea sp. NPDC050394]|uniref:polysaccharide lyase 8 family protein n=1 Tax=Nonomuraea sp. NPDC050394 TaxID=3364363 RepID=UPI0037A43615
MSLPLTRRTVLIGAGLGATAAFVAGPAQALVADTAALRLRWRALLTGGDGIDAADPDVAAAVARIGRTAAGFLATLDTGAGRGALWPDLADPARSGHVTSSFSRLAKIALSWATPGTGHHAHEPTLRVVLDALDWMSGHRYGPALARYDNDWDWEIGAPIQLNDTMVLLHDVLGAERLARMTAAVHHYTPDPNLWRADRQIATGANRVWVCTVVALRAVLDGDGSALGEVRDALSDVRGGGANSVLAFQDGGAGGTGEGFYSDGSFLQHWKHPYNGGYGKELLNTLSKLLHLLAGSTWAVRDPAVDNVFRWVDEAFDPLMFRGDMMAAVCGREVARESKQGHAAAQPVIEAALRLAGADPSRATHLTRLVKRWITEDTYRDFLKVTDLSSIVLARKALGSAAPAYPAPVLHRQYPRMDKAVHHRPGFGYAVSAYSTRIYNYESIQNENLRGWHLSDGMVLVYDGDLGHYSEDYWPTVDPHRLPGTTVERRALADGQDQRRVSAADWAGGAALPGTTLAAYGMDLRGLGTGLRALKSWFFVDDAIVCVGSGITGQDVETVLENRKLRDPQAVLTVNGAAVPGSPGTLTGVRWAHLAGTGGYVLAAPTRLRAVREARTGRWKDINIKYGSATEVTRTYLTLWLEHAAGTGYAYTQLPAASAGRTAAWSAAPAAQVVAATGAVHAVAGPGRHFLAANFWAAGRAVDLAADGPASVVTRRRGPATAVAVSDPTQKRDRVVVELFRPGLRVVRADPGVRVRTLAGRIRITAETAGRHGATLTADLA